MKKRLFAVFLLIILLFSAASIAAFADEEYAVWEFNSDGSLLRTDPDGTERIYYEERLPDRYYESYVSSDVSYTYYYFKSSPDGEEYRIRAGEKDAEWVFYDDEFGETHLYATSNGKAALSKLFSGSLSAGKLYLSSNPQRIEVEINEELAEAIDSSNTNPLKVKLYELQACEVMRLITVDEYSSITHAKGIVYEYEYTYYYLSLDRLGSNFFYKDGSLAYDGSEVEIYPLDQKTATDFKGKWQEALRIVEDYYYEDESEGIFLEDFLLTAEEATVILTVVIAIVGVALPIIPIVFSVKRIISKKEDIKSPFAVMLGGSALWLISGVLLIILILV